MHVKLIMKKNKDVDVILTETLDEYYFAKFAPFFADREARGVTKGEAKAGKMMLLEFLRGRFGKVPKRIEKAINQMYHPIDLKSWASRAASGTERIQRE